MEITLLGIAEILHIEDNFLIITHQSPDGDTLGSGYALCAALHYLGKKARVINCDVISKKYQNLKNTVEEQNFEEKYIISVDVPNVSLIGESLFIYADKIDLSIDHHSSHKDFSDLSYTDANAAATCEIIFELIKTMNVPITKSIANCLYTGITTDTGCFKFPNTTTKTHKIAAELIEHNADHYKINQAMFDMKSKERLLLESKVLNTLDFRFDEKCAIIYCTQKMVAESMALESDVDGIAYIPRQIENVLVGITLREKENGEFKISVRTDPQINANKICEEFGGGGHNCAGGCLIKKPLEEARKSLVEVVAKYL